MLPTALRRTPDISRTTGAIVSAHRNGAFEAYGFNIVHDVAVLSLVTGSWVQDCNSRNRDHLDPVRTKGRHHAASGRGTGVAI